MPKRMEALIGTSGWSYGHWKSRFYPEGLAGLAWFSYYSSIFDTVEINSSFYKWPSEKTLNNWYIKSPSEFKFTLKCPRTITHIKKLHDIDDYLLQFCSLAKLLKEKLSCILFQLPPSYNTDEKNILKLEKFLTLIKEYSPEQSDNAIEFRHKSWWNQDIFDLCKKKGAIFCSVEGLGMPEGIISSDILYLRLHGESYSTEYSKEELLSIAAKVKYIDPKKVYAYFNNDRNAYAVSNALSFRKLLSKS